MRREEERTIMLIGLMYQKLSVLQQFLLTFILLPAITARTKLPEISGLGVESVVIPQYPLLSAATCSTVEKA
jgi:hypothetical protein